MKITFIGTIGSALTADQTYSSILINEDLLLDCGEGTTQKLIRLGVVDTINTICFTHLHNDHFLGVFSLLWYYWINSNRIKQLNLIGPPELGSSLKTILDLIHTPSDAFKFKFNYIFLQDTSKIQNISINDYIIQYTKVEHYPLSFAYRILDQKTNKSVCYTGDLRPSDSIIQLSKDCDSLICESTFPDELKDFADKYFHCTPSTAAELARNSGAKKLFLNHISSVFYNKYGPLYFEKQAENKYKNKVIIAQDLMAFEI